MNDIGRCYEFGIGVEVNYVMAAEYYHKWNAERLAVRFF
jgi:TPR repeat protein